MGMHHTGTKYDKDEPLYRIHLNNDERLVICSIKPNQIISAYEGSDGSRYLYRRTIIREDDEGYYIYRDKRRFRIPRRIVNENI